jgi:hypothetical protein
MFDAGWALSADPLATVAARALAGGRVAVVDVIMIVVVGIGWRWIGFSQNAGRDFRGPDRPAASN